MAMAGLPLLKLAGLFVKTISKPVASRLKIEAGKNPKLSAQISALGQFAHQIASRANVLASGYKFLGVKPLPVEDALSKGVNFLSESIVFAVAGTIIVIEYTRSETKNAEKAAKMAAKEAEEKLFLEQRFGNLEQQIRDLETKMAAKPWLSMETIFSHNPKQEPTKQDNNNTVPKEPPMLNNTSEATKVASWWPW